MEAGPGRATIRAVSRLFKRGEIYYFEFRGKRYATGLTDRRAAEAWQREWERRYADPAYAATHQTTLTDVLVWHQDAKKQAQRSPHTLKRIEQFAGHLVRILGDELPIARIDYETVQHYITERERDAAAQTTIAKELSALRGALKGAKRKKKYSGDLDAIFPEEYSGQSKPGKRALALDQTWQLVEYLEEERAAVVAFIVATGADLGSVFTAQPGDIELEPPVRVKVRGTKTGYRDRVVPVPWDEFVALLTLAAPHVPFRPWGNVRRDLEVACRALDLTRVTPRDLRRTCGQILRREFGVPPALIAPYLGHADARMVEKVYGTIDVDSLETQLGQYGKST